MALTPERIDAIALQWSNKNWVEGGSRFNHDFAQAIEAEVRKDYDALIRQMLEALESVNQAMPFPVARAAITAARARLEG